MQILPLLLLLDPMKDLVKVDSVGYSAYLKNGYSQGQIHSTKIKKEMLTTHTNIKKL